MYTTIFLLAVWRYLRHRAKRLSPKSQGTLATAGRQASVLIIALGMAHLLTSNVFAATGNQLDPGTLSQWTWLGIGTNWNLLADAEVFFAGFGSSGLLALLLLMFLPIHKALAATYYVVTGGDDNDSGTSTAEPWETFAKAASSTSPGDIVYFGSGTYNENVEPSVDGTNGSPIRFVADTSGAFTGQAAGDVILDGPDGGKGGASATIDIDGSDYLEFEGFKITGEEDKVVQWKNSVGGVLEHCEMYGSKNGIKVDGAEIEIIKCSVYNHSDKGIEIKDSTSTTISDSSSYGNTKSGIKMDDATVSILRSTFHNNGEFGVEFKKGDNTLVNCLIYENGSGGIELDKDAATTGTIWNCTVVDNGGDGLISGGEDKKGSSGGDVTITNSIFANNDGYGINFIGGTITHTYNTVYGNADGEFDGTTADSSEFTTDPLFIDASSDDYRIGNTSPAFNSGIDASGIVDDDIRDKSRPILFKWDMGCYELGGNEGGLPALLTVESWIEAK